jgi:signal transduction histidine kinase
MMQRLAGPSVRLTLVRDPHLSQVRVDPVQMEQAILSLVSNARDAMPQGGTLRIETGNVTLQASHPVVGGEAEPGAYVMLAVADTGCGMSPDTMTHLFEPYFTTKSFELGTGLGLAPVYGFVKQSRGHIASRASRAAGPRFASTCPWPTVRNWKQRPTTRLCWPAAKPSCSPRGTTQCGR